MHAKDLRVIYDWETLDVFLVFHQLIWLRGAVGAFKMQTRKRTHAQKREERAALLQPQTAALSLLLLTIPDSFLLSIYLSIYLSTYHGSVNLFQQLRGRCKSTGGGEAVVRLQSFGWEEALQDGPEAALVPGVRHSASVSDLTWGSTTTLASASLRISAFGKKNTLGLRQTTWIIG